MKFRITEFQKSNISVNNTAFAKVVFSSIFKCDTIISYQRAAVKKVFSKCWLVQVEILFVFGILTPQYILVKLFCMGNGSCCLTLRKFMTCCTIPLWTTIKYHQHKHYIAFYELHVKRLLHNDLCSENTVVKNFSHVKILDFEKSTLVIEPRSKQYERFNTVLLFLEYELCRYSQIKWKYCFRCAFPWVKHFLHC